MKKRNSKSVIIGLARSIKFNFISRPYYLLKFLVSGTRFCRGVSYYPEKKSKGFLTIWFEQLGQTLKYGYPNDLYFSYGFDVKSRSEMKEYMHYAQFSLLRDKLNMAFPSESIILRDKFLFGMFAKYLGVATPENIGISDSDGIFDTRKRTVVPTAEFLNGLENDDLFVKPFDGECGAGIFHLEVAGKEFKVNGETTDIENLTKILESNRYLLQQKVTQNEVMASLHPQSLNTIRLVTVRHRRTGKIDVFPSILRIGAGKSIVDNTSAGGLAVGIDLSTGKLKEYGLFKPAYGTKTRIHPDSKIQLSDVTIPYFEECKKQAIRLHSMIPQLHSIGWDIAIGPNGPIFVEGNDNWEITGPQNCNGGIKKLLLEYSR